MEDLSLHILDIAENCIDAQAKKIEIRLKENTEKDLLSLEIVDDGKGMKEEMVKKVLDPFFTTKINRRVGLGLPLLAQAAKAANGRLTIQSQPGKGTKVKATFKLSHIDTKPLGDIVQTLMTLIVAHPEIDIFYKHQINDKKFLLATQEIKKRLDTLPINSPEVISFIKKNLREGIASLRREK
jgi:anti-sigma regulatory factor (Ser/Thr protein kinase)